MIAATEEFKRRYAEIDEYLDHLESLEKINRNFSKPDGDYEGLSFTDDVQLSRVNNDKYCSSRF